jgi:hypothetical protein
MMFSLRNLLIVLLLGTINVALADNEREMNEDLNQQFTVVNGCYTPRDVHIGVLECEYYLYFMIDSTGTPTQLLLHVQYCADDPLEYVAISFRANDGEYRFATNRPTLKRVKRRYFYETSDTELREDDRALIDALLTGDEVTVRLQGKEMAHVMPLSPRQCENFKRTITLYRRMGGRL